MEINNKIEKLFLKVYRDKYLRNIIYSNIRKYNKNNNKIFNNCQELNQYPQKNYIINLTIIQYDSYNNNNEDNYDSYSTLSSLDNIESLTLKNNEEKIHLEYLPIYLKCLTFSDNYHHPISSNDLPKSLRKIKFGYNWNYRINLKNTNIDTIILGNGFNQIIKAGDLPLSLKEIIFGYNYSQPLEIGSIPSGVEKITFGYCYNHPLEVGIIPKSCKILKLGGKYNHPFNISGIIPEGVEEIYFSTYWNHQLKPLDLPLSSIKKIEFNYHYNKKLIFGSIPPSVTHLSFGNSFTNDNSKITAGVIPFGVTHLTFGDSFNIQLLNGTIPDSVTFLCFGFKFSNNSKSFKNVLPKNLLHLEFKNNSFQFPIKEKPPNCILINKYTPMQDRKYSFIDIIGKTVLFIALVIRAIYDSITDIFGRL
ncbi:hypothetical protein ACTFIV_011123 [Dictyostelium citrinum]